MTRTPPKGASSLALPAQPVVDGIQDVGAHHGDLVDNEGDIPRLEDVARIDLILLAVEQEALARQPEQ